MERIGALLLLLVLALPAHAAVEMYYLHNDHLGTPRVVTNQAQQVVWKGQLKPFGEMIVEIETITNHRRFPGQRLDIESRLHYNYFRDYDPRTGRYMQSDPIGLAGGLNSYAYVGGNPLRYSDLYGLRARISCRIVPVVGWVSGARHCYAEIDPDDGSGRETYGLIGDTGGPLSSTGTIYKNNNFDTGGTSCDWNEDPTVDQCVRDAAQEYANPSTYSFASGPNSNTFAGTLARKCNLAKPSGWAPGWSDLPATQAEDTTYIKPTILE